ncbi:MAG: hypothetical protein COY42_00525 [Armatimonadetes bacterium CG_4_10_14_0_8_um_filter_66_14]|nr:MAG: hypothetical protein COY42_00525 [Armatimonadetes bacterium CG_4_10_14_0_8_um_filter_66_14]
MPDTPLLCCLLVTCLLCLPSAAPAEPVPNIAADGDFNSPALRLVQSGEPGVWVGFVHGQSDAAFVLVANEGRGGSRCVRYSKTAEGNQNIHLDQLVPVEKGTVYEGTAWVRGDGKLSPLLAVLTMEWHVLTTAPVGASPEWRQVRFVFDSEDNEQVRFEWFPGADGKLYTGVAGTSFLDDVSVRKKADVLPSLRQAFDLVRERKGDAIDLALNPDATFDRPPWGNQTQRPWERVCALDWDAAHHLAMRLPGWEGPVSVSRVEADRQLPLPCPRLTGGFDAKPGTYRVVRR